MTTIAVGAPKTPKGETTGYFYMLPITETPPTDATTAVGASAIDVGFVGADGVALTAEIDSEMIQDWNLDDVLQIKNGASASVEVPVFGWSMDQAKVIYSADAVSGTEDNFKVNWAGELPAHVYLVFELRGVNGDARLVCEAQIASPGEVSFTTNTALTHTVTAALFKNENFKDGKGRSSFFSLMDGTATP